MFGGRGPHTELGAHETTRAEYVVVSYSVHPLPPLSVHFTF